MKYADVLGHKISRLGLGSPRPFRHGADDLAAEALIRGAFDLGINFFDTAPAYGSEHNLSLLSLSKRDRQTAFYSTKSPHRMSIRQGWRKVPEKLQLTLENSLRAMKTDYIDFYFLHALTLNVFNKITPEIWEALAKFKEQGKVRYIGVSEDAVFDPFHVMAPAALMHPVIDILMLANYRRPLIFTLKKPTIGMLVNGPIIGGIIHHCDVTLTGTSNLEHLKQNVSAFDEKLKKGKKGTGTT